MIAVSDDASETGPTEAIRRTLDASGDPRVARTRAAITDAVHRLSHGDGELTVSAIVRESGISRASFYSHFSGLDELGIHLMRDAFAAIAEDYATSDAPPAEAMRRSQRMLVQHYVENLALYRAVAALPVSKDGYLAGVRAMAALIEPALGAHPEAAARGGDTSATARYIAGAAYGLIDAWLTDEVELDADELAERLTTLLPPWFSGIR